MKTKDKKVWAIAYINRTFIEQAESELAMYEELEGVEIYIPTVKILKKKFKGKQLYEFIPLLFNYGFFSIPFKKACDPEYLLQLRHKITCIYGWVKDPASSLAENHHMREDNQGFSKSIPRAALAKDKEVSRMIKASQTNSVYGKQDLEKLNKGDYIKLEGYPFDGMPAEIITINHRKKEVKVKLMIDEITKDITVSFDNVFYTVYKNFNEKSRESSSDELKEKYGQNTIDHITWKNQIS